MELNYKLVSTILKFFKTEENFYKSQEKKTLLGGKILDNEKEKEFFIALMESYLESKTLTWHMDSMSKVPLNGDFEGHSCFSLLCPSNWLDVSYHGESYYLTRSYYKDKEVFPGKETSERYVAHYNGEVTRHDSQLEARLWIEERARQDGFHISAEDELNEFAELFYPDKEIG